jgi:hypothetical protein
VSTADNNKSPAPPALKFTKTELRMLRVLSDAAPHTRRELFACLWEQDAPLSNIRAHISNIRKQLMPLGEDILCVYFDRQIQYRHVKLIPAETLQTRIAELDPRPTMPLGRRPGPG